MEIGQGFRRCMCFFQAEDGIRDLTVTGVQTCALPIFAADDDESDFAFMRSEVSREKPVDYVEMAELMVQEKARGGYIVWVLGPAILHARGQIGRASCRERV